VNKPKSIPVSVWITLALVAASIEPIVAKFAFKDGTAAIQLIALKNILGGLFMLPILRSWFKQSFDARAFWQLAPVGLLLFATNSLTLIALKSLSVVLLITIITCVPALVGILNNIMGRDSLGPKFWLGFAMCFLGVVLTLDYKDLFVNGFGIGCAFAAALSSSFYRVRIEVLCEKYNPTIAASFTYMVQGAASLALLPWALPLSASAAGFGCWIGISAALANLAFVYALNLVGSTRISVLTMVQRPLLIIAAAILLHETASVLQWIGVLLVMVGIQFAQVKRLQAEPIESASTFAGISQENVTAPSATAKPL
jgi:drug/metabolite transporter (DMT)-like permease